MRRFNPLIMAAASFVLLAIIAVAWNILKEGPFTAPPLPQLSPTPSVGPRPFINETALEELTGPAGYRIKTFASGLGAARFMARDEKSDTLFVSLIKDGIVIGLRDRNNDGVAEEQFEVAKNLRNPHGLALRDDWLYIAEEHRIGRIRLFSDAPYEIVLEGLPASADLRGHITRTIGFGPDGKLYVSIGSSCNVCREEEPWRATIIRSNPDGKNPEIFARGLRNAVGFIWDDQGRIWATDNGRDELGDELPPDEINIVGGDRNYGWPICYGKNIHDTNFDPVPKQVRYGASKNICEQYAPSYIDLPAHVAPLGLRFGPDGNLYVALHGSWNRGKPAGYKIIRIIFGPEPKIEDFVTGFMPKRYLEKSLGITAPAFAHGRPVDILFDEKDRMYISDDKAGAIYRLEKI